MRFRVVLVVVCCRHIHRQQMDHDGHVFVLSRSHCLHVMSPAGVNMAEKLWARKSEKSCTATKGRRLAHSIDLGRSCVKPVCYLGWTHTPARSKLGFHCGRTQPSNSESLRLPPCAGMRCSCHRHLRNGRDRKSASIQRRASAETESPARGLIWTAAA